ncbi:MAG: AsmA family protein [Acetobacter sp.]|nr:AsmA family protein [Acetobacter sp.]
MKRTIKIILISVISICVVAFVAAYIALTQIDFNRYKEMIVKVVRDTTGRELTIGDIQVKASFNPTIEVKNVTFSNAEWAKTPVMVSADAVDLGFAVVPLLKKNIVIDVFKLKGVVVNLEEGANGKGNWDFNLPKDLTVQAKSKMSSFTLVKSVQAAEVKTQSDVSNILSSLVVKQVALENVKINFTDKSAKTASYDIDYLNLDEDVNENIDFKFNVNKGLYNGTGKLGALNQLDSSLGYPVKAELDVMGIKADVDVLLYDILGDIRFDGTAKASGFMGKDSGYNEAANVTFKGDLKKIDARINSFNIAGNEIKGTLTATLASRVPVITAILNSAKIDIASFSRNSKSAYNFSLISAANATTLVPAEVIPYQALYGVNATADVTISQLVNSGVVLAKDVGINAKVNDGAATVKILKGIVADGNVMANLTANAQSETVNINADVSKLNLLKLMKALKADSEAFNFISGSDTDIHIKLSGNGRTYAAVVDSLDGQIIAIVNKSELHLGNIGLLKGNIISQLFDTLKLTKGNDDLNLSCAVVRSDIQKGKAQFPNGIVLNADKFTLVADGSVNLVNDKISISIKPFAGKLTDTNIAKALSSLVKLTGTLQNPKIGIDSANAVKTIVGVTTGGPVYLGAQMLLENDGSPCYTALQGTGYETMFPKPENVIQSTTGDVGQILDDSVGVVKDTTKGLLNLLSGGRLEQK